MLVIKHIHPVYKNKTEENKTIKNKYIEIYRNLGTKPQNFHKL